MDDWVDAGPGTSVMVLIGGFRLGSGHRTFTRKIWVTIGVLTLFIFDPAIAAAADPEWAWFAVVAESNKWLIRKGRADVKLVGEMLSVELYDNRELPISLQGSVKKGKVEVQAIRHGTMDTPVRLVGEYRKIRWPTDEGGGVREAIRLTQSGEPGGLTIGLTRGR